VAATGKWPRSQNNFGVGIFSCCLLLASPDFLPARPRFAFFLPSPFALPTGTKAASPRGSAACSWAEFPKGVGGQSAAAGQKPSSSWRRRLWFNADTKILPKERDARIFTSMSSMLIDAGSAQLQQRQRENARGEGEWESKKISVAGRECVILVWARKEAEWSWKHFFGRSEGRKKQKQREKEEMEIEATAKSKVGEMSEWTIKLVHRWISGISKSGFADLFL
jgi:hypothetical protein